MSPAILLIGFVVGLLTLRVRTLVLVSVVLGLTWGVLIAAEDSFSGLPAAFAVGAANAAIGIGVGSAIYLVSFGVSRCLRRSHFSS